MAAGLMQALYQATYEAASKRARQSLLGQIGTTKSLL